MLGWVRIRDPPAERDRVRALSPYPKSQYPQKAIFAMLLAKITDTLRSTAKDELADAQVYFVLERTKS